MNSCLDSTGFQIVKHKSEEKEFKDEAQVKKVYYKEIEVLLKKVTGASKIFIFGHTIRRAAKSSLELSLLPSFTNSLRGPVQRVHIDQSYSAGPTYVKLHLPAEASMLLKTSYQIINIWRPIKTILKDPLAVADARSVLDNDLIPIKLIYADREGENFAVKARDGHKWYYIHKQTPQEVLLLKCFDSKMDGRARRVPHTSFIDEEYEREMPRESIEVRALVFHEDDDEASRLHVTNT
ncbi:hypothetical protein BP5796_09813 [Coleophoma crateriformis]|uniref:Uncharacterized protein n=1 Tax=Coleophoma crateriformis TaxID=565419 RepID=A0A3D8QZR2_9HELO|nr:hypothetical protein BP5796_09813 [Coleophoma crateriformis]